MLDHDLPTDVLAPGWVRLPLRTPTLPPATHTNAALIGLRRIVVVDPGSPFKDQQALLHSVLQARLDQGAEVVGVALTHHHGDHVGGVAALSDWLLAHAGARPPVLAHAETLARVQLPQDTPTLALSDGDVLDVDAVRVVALHTPGHAPGHLAFWSPALGLAHIGDMMASEGTILVQPPEGDMTVYLDQLARLRDLGASRFVPSHGDPIVDPSGHASHYIDHRLMREARVEGALSDTPQTPLQLVPLAYPDTPRMLYPLASGSLLAHLIKLGAEGRAVRQGERWRRPAAES